ncbi:MAG: hypothetical protein HOV79_02105 [Hamadaea sp.]|nr:hypothetical protein [Hamadaea sp.]
MTEPTGTASEHTSAVDRAITQIQENADKMVEDFNKLVDRWNDNRWWLIVGGLGGGIAAWMISDWLEDIKNALNKMLDIVRPVLAHHTPVISLINISFHWLDAVKKPVSNMSPTVQKYATENLAYWEGGTASHYKEQVVPPQMGATDALAAKAGFISEWLYGIAQSNVDYVTELATVIGTIAGEVTTALIEAATVIDIPWAIQNLAQAAGHLVETAVNNLTSIAQRIVQAGGNARAAVSDKVDESKFPGGAWPQAVKG